MSNPGPKERVLFLVACIRPRFPWFPQEHGLDIVILDLKSQSEGKDSLLQTKGKTELLKVRLSNFDCESQ